MEHAILLLDLLGDKEHWEKGNCRDEGKYLDQREWDLLPTMWNYHIIKEIGRNLLHFVLYGSAN